MPNKTKCMPALPGWLFSLLRWPSVETTEWFCLRSAAWWMLTLTPVLHLFATNRAFAGLEHVGAEWRWQLALGLGLAVQILAVLRGCVWTRVLALFLFGFMWAFVAGLFWASCPHAHGIPLSTGIGPYVALSTDCMVAAIHLVRLWYIDHLAAQERTRLAAVQSVSAEGE